MSRTHVLIAEQFNLGIKQAHSTYLAQPANWVDWASMYDELTWTLTVLGITDGGTVGTPANTLATAFSVKARFQYRQMHAGSVYRFQTARWSNMTEDEVGTHVVEARPLYGPGQAPPTVDPVTGVGDGVIATHLTTGYNGTTGLFANPIVVRRTMRHFPAGVRVNLDGLSFTGGTAPRALVGLEVCGKGAR
jgi:hypothetical protein